MIQIREETLLDIDAREELLDACFGPARFQKTCERLREGRLPARELALVVEQNGALIATVRLWNISAGPGRPALLLGPIAVAPARRSLGLGSKLMREALARAAALGHESVLLVGDAPYYERFGFSADNTSSLWLPGPYERERFLGRELVAGALEGARGLVSAKGEVQERPDLAALIAASQREAAAFRRAA